MTKAQIAETARRPGSDSAASTGELLEPFFRKREDAQRTRKLQSPAERLKFADAFALVGCLRCQSKNRLHAGCGLCESCYQWYTNVLCKVVRDRQKGETE